MMGTKPLASIFYLSKKSCSKLYSICHFMWTVHSSWFTVKLSAAAIIKIVGDTVPVLGGVRPLCTTEVLIAKLVVKMGFSVMSSCIPGHRRKPVPHQSHHSSHLMSCSGCARQAQVWSLVAQLQSGHRHRLAGSRLRPFIFPTFGR